MQLDPTRVEYVPKVRSPPAPLSTPFLPSPEVPFKRGQEGRTTNGSSTQVPPQVRQSTIHGVYPYCAAPSIMRWYGSYKTRGRNGTNGGTAVIASHSWRVRPSFSSKAGFVLFLLPSPHTGTGASRHTVSLAADPQTKERRGSGILALGNRGVSSLGLTFSSCPSKRLQFIISIFYSIRPLGFGSICDHLQCGYLVAPLGRYSSGPQFAHAQHGGCGCGCNRRYLHIASVILQATPVHPELSHHTVLHISRQTVGAKCLVPCTMRNDAAVTRTWTGQTACNVVSSPFQQQCLTSLRRCAASTGCPTHRNASQRRIARRSMINIPHPRFVIAPLR
ncbi:uncharacterized protein CLUP02_07456 [Colletotrichum lupini]|uniref:Uncharacterized protein n=1 Tax=Colletotrichum lupini TaxID=145971 RepID=A0A9Q8SRX5_9PEZI|nr:uncharacterized protein CLUP02_07456 [Colletotrichum lupini]UQC81970.1 hypothetical protein CLUP02_07456 [Colletotrichum lupini]